MEKPVEWLECDVPAELPVLPLTGAVLFPGQVVSVQTPTLACNWDPGITFVTFATPQHAEAALEALDGTPSCVPGCNMYVDFAEVKETARYAFDGPAGSTEAPPQVSA